MIDEIQEPTNLLLKKKHPFEIIEVLGSTTLTVHHNDIVNEIVSSSWVSDWHYHSMCEIVILVSGEEQIIFDNQTDITMSSHDICIIPRQLSHSCFPLDEKQKRISLLISLSQPLNDNKKKSKYDILLSEIFEKTINHTKSPILLKNQTHLYNDIGNLLSIVESKVPLSSMIFKHQVLLFVFKCLSHVYQKTENYKQLENFDLSLYNTDSAEIRNQQIENFIYNHHRNCTVEDLAQHLHLSVRQTNRIINKLYGMPFQDALNRHRILLAQRMLLRGEKPTVVAEQIGYKSIGGFRKAFKKVTNHTPSDFVYLYVTQKNPPPPSTQLFNPDASDKK